MESLSLGESSLLPRSICAAVQQADLLGDLSERQTGLLRPLEAVQAFCLRLLGLHSHAA